MLSHGSDNKIIWFCIEMLYRIESLIAASHLSRDDSNLMLFAPFGKKITMCILMLSNRSVPRLKIWQINKQPSILVNYQIVNLEFCCFRSPCYTMLLIGTLVQYQSNHCTNEKLNHPTPHVGIKGSHGNFRR